MYKVSLKPCSRQKYVSPYTALVSFPSIYLSSLILNRPPPLHPSSSAVPILFLNGIVFVLFFIFCFSSVIILISISGIIVSHSSLCLSSFLSSCSSTVSVCSKFASLIDYRNPHFVTSAIILLHHPLCKQSLLTGYKALLLAPIKP